MKPDINLREPRSTDGFSVHKLIAKCSPLDTNSVYCNLLQCTHFANTSVIALAEEEVAGFISGYLTPEREDTLFIWQVAVAEEARGAGLASRMIENIINRDHKNQIKYIQTTITESNQASWALFRAVASKLKAELSSEVVFDKEKHFCGEHDSEILVTIGPYKQIQLSNL